MSFNNRVLKSYAQGATSAFIAPWASYKGSVIALSGVTTGNITSTAGLVISMPSPQYDLEWDSLSANVQAGITTNALAVVTLWQVSNDNTNWATLYAYNAPAYVQLAANGTGSLVTTSYMQGFQGMNVPYPYVRLAVSSTGATGAAGDNVTVSYNFRRRWLA